MERNATGTKDYVPYIGSLVLPASDVSVGSVIISDKFVCKDNASRHQAGTAFLYQPSLRSRLRYGLEGVLLIAESPHAFYL
jgi:hypothetical protein